MAGRGAADRQLSQRQARVAERVAVVVGWKQQGGDGVEQVRAEEAHLFRVQDVVGDAQAGDGEIRRAAGEEIVAGQAVQQQRVRAQAAIQRVRRLVAVHQVVPRPADGILDQRPRVAIRQQRIGDVADRLMPEAELGELVRRGHRPFTRAQVHGHALRVRGKVIGVVAATIPDGHEDPVAGRRRLGDPVDGKLPARRVPVIDRVAGAGREVGAVHVLQGRDVVEHRCLRVA